MTLQSRLRLSCFLLASLPLWLAVYWAFSGGLGANPIEALTHHTGLWALRFLLLTLCMSPLRKWLKQPWPIWLRRQLGLWSFFYASLHFLTFLIFDLSLDFRLLGEEVLERPYITVGFTAFCLLIPLAVTSTRNWQRRLGRRWKSLHKLVYLSLLLALIHFVWKTKVIELEPSLYVLCGLLLVLVRRYRAGKIGTPTTQHN